MHQLHAWASIVCVSHELRLCCFGGENTFVVSVSAKMADSGDVPSLLVIVGPPMFSSEHVELIADKLANGELGNSVISLTC
jgi:hypothetical protein